MSADNTYLSGTLNSALLNAESKQADKLKQSLQNAQTKEQAEKVAKEFEAIFISQMLKHMYAGIESDPLFGGGSAETIYRDMTLDEYGKTLSETGRLGIADSVMKEILSLQEVKENDK